VFPQMYEPLLESQRQFEPAQEQLISPTRSLHLVVAVNGNPLAAQASLEKAVYQLDPLLAVTEISTMEEVVAASETSRRFNTAILTAFAAIALALALLGIYGVLAYSVAERGRQIAIRMALGSTRQLILWTTLGHALRLAAVGILLGLVASAGLTRFLSSLLYHVKPLDTGAIAFAALLLAFSAAAAGFIPARRAASSDPMRALRME
jgi:ABC-type antimicrobial peptide transport system permease subunit